MTLVLILSVFFARVEAQFPEWLVPEKEAAIENPVAATDMAISNGRALYSTQCVACHGPQGLGDGAIPSGSLVSEIFRSQTDGSIFWKLQQGRGQMPSFAALPAEQLWEVIHFLRELGKPIDVLTIRKAMIELQLSDEEGTGKVVARVWEIKSDGDRVPLVGKRVVLGVKRMFGILPMKTSSNYTNASGVISGQFPDHLPADTAGQVVIIAYVDDPGFEPGTAQQSVSWGKTLEFTDITKQRSLWAQMKYAPWWLIIAFTSVAGAIWLTILFVMLELKKINDQGRKFLKQKNL